MKLRWRKAAPSEVCILLPAISWVSLGLDWVSNNTAYELSAIFYSCVVSGFAYMTKSLELIMDCQ
jgi:hypothetical protein